MGNDALAEAIHSMSKSMMFIKEGRLDDEMALTADLLKEKFQFNPDVVVGKDKSAIRIEFGEDVLFRSGQAIPRASARKVILDLGEILRTVPFTVVVEGHTDSIRLAPGGKFKDNWELSLARSMSIVRLLVEEGGLPANQIAAAAYGSYRPKSSNETADGRRLNRRVEIALFKDFPYGTPRAASVPKAMAGPAPEVNQPVAPSGELEPAPRS
jgi:chemotaxis protein MotB